MPPAAAFQPPEGFEIVKSTGESLKKQRGIRRKRPAVSAELQGAIDQTVRLKNRDAVFKLPEEMRERAVAFALEHGVKGNMYSNADGNKEIPVDVAELGRVAAMGEMMPILEVQLELFEEAWKREYYLALELRHAHG